MYISDFAKIYPEAKCIGPAGIAQKKTDIKWDGIMGEGGENKVYGFEDEVSTGIAREGSSTTLAVNLTKSLPCPNSTAQTPLLPRPRQQRDCCTPHPQQDSCRSRSLVQLAP
jgi:hypothetical protein